MKGIRGSTEFEKQFLSNFQRLCNRHRAWQVWQDFVHMSACAIANAVDRRPDVWDLREASYMATVKKYSKDELNLVSEPVPRLKSTELPKEPVKETTSEKSRVCKTLQKPIVNKSADKKKSFSWKEFFTVNGKK